MISCRCDTHESSWSESCRTSKLIICHKFDLKGLQRLGNRCCNNILLLTVLLEIFEVF